MTDVLPGLDSIQARTLTDKIKIAIEGTWLLVTEAYERRAWAALGYQSWDDYCTREFGTARLRLPREERQEVVASLRDSGLSNRAIASATGLSEGTVRNDLRAGAQNYAPAAAPVVGTDGKTYQATSREPRQDEDDLWAGVDADQEPPPVAPRPSVTPFTPPAHRPEPRAAPVMLTLRTHKGEAVEYPKPAAKPTFNETAGEGISWASWSWNPVTGCLHGCDYCYARAIANRFTDAYPAGFTPLFHHERLEAPINTSVPAARRGDPAYKRVFVCSMADLYGRWIPDEWIEQVHASMLAAPWWQYILLTKFPARYVGLDLPPNAWVGTSVDEQKRVRIAEDAFRKIDGVKVKWLSLEPLREPLEFSDLSMFDWVVIGAQTETRQPDGTVPAFMPDWEWVCRITAQAKAAGCKVHWKPNLLNGKPGLPLDEYPMV